MVEFSKDSFKEYIVQRNKNFEWRHNPMKYRLTYIGEFITLENHLPNTLKFLDSQSQRLYKSLNDSKADLEDKLATVFVYRALCNESAIKRYTDIDGIVKPDKLLKLQEYLNKGKTFRQHYRTLYSLDSGKGKGDYLMYALEEFMTVLINNDIIGIDLKELFKLFKHKDNISLTGNDILFDLITDLAYIDNLKIKDSFVTNKGCHSLAHKMYRSIAGKSQEEFNKEIIDWYMRHQWSDTILYNISHTDIPHIVHGYWRHLSNYSDKRTKSGRVFIEDFIVPAYKERHEEISL